MAQRNYTYVQALEKEVKILYGSMVVGSTGAVGTVKGGFTITRNSAGNYTIVYPDKYNRLLWASAGFISTAGSGIASVEIITDPSTLQSGFRANGSYIIQCYDFAGAAADPSAASVLSFVAHVRNTDVSVGND
jgi:hypothetical protein